MDTRTWLTNNHKVVVDGELGSICVRLLMFWTFFSAPLIMAALLIKISLPPSYAPLAICLSAIPCLLYVHLIIQGIRVFRPAENKDTDSGAFLVAQIVVYPLFIFAALDQAKILDNDDWALLGFAIGISMSLFHFTFLAIAVGARQKAPASTWAAFIVALTSSVLFFKEQMLL